MNYMLRKGWRKRERMYLSQEKLLVGISLCHQWKEKKLQLVPADVSMLLLEFRVASYGIITRILYPLKVSKYRWFYVNGFKTL